MILLLKQRILNLVPFLLFIQEPLGNYLLSPFLPRVPVQGVSIEIWLLLFLMLSLHGLTIILCKLDDLPLMACFQTTLFRPYVPTLEDLLSVGFHRSKGQAPTFMRTCLNMVLVNDAMFSHWYGISYPLRNPKHECAHFVNK